MKVWVAIINERHSDNDAEVFTAPDAAIDYVKKTVAGWARTPEDIEEELSDRMREAGWIYFVTWSSEDDSAWVIEKETDPMPADGGTHDDS